MAVGMPDSWMKRIWRSKMSSGIGVETEDEARRDLHALPLDRADAREHVRLQVLALFPADSSVHAVRRLDARGRPC